MRRTSKGISTSSAVAVLVVITIAASVGYFYAASGTTGSQTSVQSTSSTQPGEWRAFNTREIHIGCCPGYVAFDPNTGFLYVTVQPANTVYAVSPATGEIVANISVGRYPRDLVVNPINGMVYVVNQGSDSVSVIDGSTNRVVATVPVGRNPVEVAVNPRNGLIYVPDELSHELTVISGSNNSVIAEVSLGCNGPCTNSSTGVPNSVDVDPTTNSIYVASDGVNFLQVLNGSTYGLVATIPVGTYPDGVAVDPESGTVYVPNMLNDSVSVVDASTRSVVKTVPVGIHPHAVEFDPVLGDVFVANEGNSSLSVIGAMTNTLLANIRVGASGINPGGITVDPASGDVYGAVPEAGNVTVISKCVTSLCTQISGATPPCGSYGVVWTYPNYSPVSQGSQVSSTITTCTKGMGSWSVRNLDSNVTVAGGTFSCPCADVILFDYTAGVSPVTKGTYWFQESFNGAGGGNTFEVD